MYDGFEEAKEKMKERLLFVTNGGEDSGEGFPYVLELAKALDSGIAVLMVYGKSLLQGYEDMMAAVAFAEAGETGMVRELVNEQEKGIREAADRRAKEFTLRCMELSVGCSCYVVVDDAIKAIKDFLKERPWIEMILLSPSLSGSKKGMDLKRLFKNISKPVVTMSRSMKAGA
jgi:hypothetical protein